MGGGAVQTTGVLSLEGTHVALDISITQFLVHPSDSTSYISLQTHSAIFDERPPSEAIRKTLRIPRTRSKAARRLKPESIGVTQLVGGSDKDSVTLLEEESNLADANQLVRGGELNMNG